LQSGLEQIKAALFFSASIIWEVKLSLMSVKITANGFGLGEGGDFYPKC
jgi:hypothetical protein